MVINPMLAETLDLRDIDRLDWKSYCVEPKLDGIRIIAHVTGDNVRLQGRYGKDLTAKFPEIAIQTSKPCILDGEIVSKDMKFESIQHRIHCQRPLDIMIRSKQYPCVFFVFDILNWNGDDLTEKPLIERKDILSSNIISNYSAKILPFWVNEDGAVLFNKIKSLGFEGIIAKRLKSSYQVGKRSSDWLKIKAFKEGVFVIAGITVGEGSRKDTFGSLILGKIVDGKLTYIGNAGSGLSEDMLRKYLKLFEGLRQEECPFPQSPDLGKELKFWMRPIISCEVRYLEEINGNLRFPIFRRLVYKGINEQR